MSPKALLEEAPQAHDPEAFLREASEPFAFIRRSGGLYESATEDDPEAVFALQLPVVDAGEVIDIVAWQPDYPLTWWRRRGVATMLGGHNLWRPLPAEIAADDSELAFQIARETIAARWTPRSILLVESPAEYLANRGDRTVCVLNWDEVDLIEMFENEPPIHFASNRLREQFDRRWAQRTQLYCVPRYRVAA